MDLSDFDSRETRQFYINLAKEERRIGLKKALQFLQKTKGKLKEDKRAKEKLFYEVFDDFQRALNTVHKVYRTKNGYIVIYTHDLSWQTRIAYLPRLTQKAWINAEEISVYDPWENFWKKFR